MNTSSNDKGFSSKGHLKKVLRIGNRTLIVIDESIVNYLSIEEDSWLEQQVTENGILMKIHYFNENGKQDIVHSEVDRNVNAKTPISFLRSSEVKVKTGVIKSYDRERNF